MRSLRGSGAIVLHTGRTAACLAIYSHAIVISCVIAAVDELSQKVKLKLSQALMKYHTMKTYGGVER